MLVRYLGAELPDDGLIFRTRPVPVALLANSSVPLVASKFVKNNVPFTFVNRCGAELPAPGLWSATSTVPPAVPLDFQSSLPFVGSNAAKNNVPPTLVSDSG